MLDWDFSRARGFGTKVVSRTPNKSLKNHLRDIKLAHTSAISQLKSVPWARSKI